MLIGIAGDPRSGKDSVAAALAGYGFRRYALADPMKARLVALDPLVGPWVTHDDVDAPVMRLSYALEQYGGYEGLKASPYGREWRRLCEREGTEGGRLFYGEDHWINTLERVWTSDGHTADSDLVIPDIRFDNEAEWIRRHGGKVVKVKRPGTQKTTHISSREMPAHYVDYLIHNGGSLDDLAKETVEMLRFFGQKVA